MIHDEQQHDDLHLDGRYSINILHYNISFVRELYRLFMNSWSKLVPQHERNVKVNVSMVLYRNISRKSVSLRLLQNYYYFKHL